MSAMPKVALVTGAGSGIGRATSLLFAERGWAVAAGDRSATGLDETLARAATSERVRTTALDVLDCKMVDAWIKETERAFGGVDALVAAAAIGDTGRIDELAPEQWEEVIAITLLGTTNCCRAAIPKIRERGGGSIVTFGSVLGRSALPGCGAYGAAKAGVEALTRALAVDHGPEGIRVNCILPGSTNTPMMWRGIDESEIPTVRRRQELEIPLRRIAEPAEIARAVYFLTSDEASYVNGASLVVDGGLLSRIVGSV